MPIPANGTVVLGPSGYHLMLMDLKAPLQKGETFKASLTFEHAGTIEATLPCRQRRGVGAGRSSLGLAEKHQH